jgi:vacuolar-type H+-ATPase subunit H
MNAVRDGIQTARDKVDEATETARQKVGETTETARQKIDETTGQVQDAIAKASDGAGSATDDAPTESLEIESDSEMTPAT